MLNMQKNFARLGKRGVNRVNRIAFALTGLLLIFAMNTSTIEAEEKIDFAYSAIDPAGFTGFWMASQKNFFEQNGISHASGRFPKRSSQTVAASLTPPTRASKRAALSRTFVYANIA
jgi:hypothetical protein